MTRLRCFSHNIILSHLHSFVGGSSPHPSFLIHDSVVIAIAMEAEAAPFIEHFGLTPKDDVFPSSVPFLAYSGTFCKGGTAKVTVITNGKDDVYKTGVDNVGTISAAMATFLALQSLGDDVDLLLNAGTCGGFGAKGAGIGDAFLTTAVANHDRRIPIPGFTEYGIGKLDSVVDPTKLAAAHGFKTGVCTTGNSLDKTEKDNELMLANDASVKDMEAAAIAWSCALQDVPFLGLKVVTDIVDGDIPSQDEFMANLQAASKSLQEALPKVLEYMCDKHHTEL